VRDWVLFDYGGVLCTDQPAADRRALLTAAGLDPDDGQRADRFWAGYWRLRVPYDRSAMDSAEYWTRLLGRPPEPATLRELSEIDVASWCHPYEATLRLVTELADRGTGLALLSNCPPALAAAIDSMSWTDLVRHRFYSCRLGRTKPDPDAYRAVLAELAADPAGVTFVDDRPANVAGAETVGMRALLFTDPATLAADLDLEGET